jgi:hypothetical protein
MAYAVLDVLNHISLQRFYLGFDSRDVFYHPIERHHYAACAENDGDQPDESLHKE